MSASQTPSKRERTTSEGVTNARLSISERRAARMRARGEERTTLKQRAASIPEAMHDLASAHARALVVIGIAVAFVALLYVPVRSYYVAMRTNQDLQRIADAYEQQNQALLQEIMRLHSQEGIEDEAHKRGLGYEDETTVTVEGVEDDALPEELGEIQLEDDRAWYVKVLDFLFVYTFGNWQ